MGNVTFDNRLSLAQSQIFCFLLLFKYTCASDYKFQLFFFIETISQRKNLKPFLEQIIKTFKTGFILKK